MSICQDSICFVSAQMWPLSNFSIFKKSNLFKKATPSQPLQNWPRCFHLQATGQRFSWACLHLCIHAAMCPPLTSLPARYPFLFPWRQLWQDETVVVCLPVYTCCADLLLLYSRHRQADRWQPHWHHQRTTNSAASFISTLQMFPEWWHQFWWVMDSPSIKGLTE